MIIMVDFAIKGKNGKKHQKCWTFNFSLYLVLMIDKNLGFDENYS